MKTIALISTGDELVNGEILDTNGQYFAQQLLLKGMVVKEHIIVSDEQDDIERVVRFLLERHHAIIVCGGLGPTSDDRTRFALASVVGEALVFDDTSWDYITQRLHSFNIVIHESNRQQALFPEHALVIPNVNGTAPACRLVFEDKIIFMLPGPPRECRPLFDEYVLPYLASCDFAYYAELQLFKMMGVIEADLASDVDMLVQGAPIKTSYRFNYPYIDVKLLAEKVHAGVLAEKVALIAARYQESLVSRTQANAVELLKKYLSEKSLKFGLVDELTGGAFQELFSTYCCALDEADILIEAKGENFHHEVPQYMGRAELSCCVSYQGVKKEKRISVPRRGHEIEHCALHFICFAVYASMQSVLLGSV